MKPLAHNKGNQSILHLVATSAIVLSCHRSDARLFHRTAELQAAPSRNLPLLLSSVEWDTVLIAVHQS